MFIPHVYENCHKLGTIRWLIVWTISFSKEHSCKKGVLRIMEPASLVSSAFALFEKEAPAHRKAWLEAVQGLGAASRLDPKTEALAYLAVLAAARLDSGLPFHVKQAQHAGATREEIISAVLVGLPAVGNGVISALPAVIASLEES